jgi:DHA1 family arabinose polymer transporter-like MFS transporter
MKKSLLALMFGGLGIGITEFVMMGLLPDLALNLKISIPQAGYLIAIYAMGVVIGAPLLILATGKYPPKKLLIFLMVLFTVFNASSAFAPDYHLLLLTRFLSGLPHGAFFGVGAVVASRIAEKGKESQAISIMFAGLTFANLAGVPLGTFIGHNYLWRYTFILIALVGIITIASLKAWLPVLKATESKNLKDELAFFSHIDSWLIILIIAIGTGGLFSWISYIAPLLTEVTHFNANLIPYIMALAGLGMVVGNIMGGKLADKYSPVNAVMVLLFVMTVSLVVIHFTAQYKILSLIMTFVTGATSFAIVSPIQMLMINSSKGSEMLASSISQACFNIGNALGAFLGGLPIVFGFAYNTPELVGATMTCLGAMIVGLLIIKTSKNIKLENCLITK